MKITIRIASIVESDGTETEIQTPAGTMMCNIGDMIVTDDNGGRWVWTKRQLLDFQRALSQHNN